MKDIPGVQCMDAAVTVETNCGHTMCVLCAQAVCAMPNRAVVCPFCRQAITSMHAIEADNGGSSARV